MSLEQRFEQRDLWGADAPGDATYRIRESARARRLSVRVMRTGRVEVVVPPRTSPRLIERFLGEHREWIERKRMVALRSAPVVEAFPPAAVRFAINESAWRVHLAGGEGRATLRSSESLLHFSGLPNSNTMRELLRRWLLVAARPLITELLVEVAGTMGVSYSALQVRRQRSRWGSCSSKGVVSINACLVFQPRDVARYLMVHELTHLTHMNHSRRFWAAVERHEPGWRERDRKLLEGWRNVPQWVFGHE
jgi:predicted metal-dependent hydrolase